MNLTEVKRYTINKLNTLLSTFYRKKVDQNLKRLNKVLILPPDEFGSIGDEAMIIAAIQNVKSNSELQSDILSFEAESWGERLNSYKGFDKEIVVNSKFGNPFNLFEILNIANKYDFLIIIGADILDGHYSSVQSAKRFLISKLLSNLGVKVIVTGSSFNNSIHPAVLNELNKIQENPNQNFRLNARDIKSHQRLTNIPFNAKLTMDIAFLLQPVKPEGYHDFLTFVKNGDYISININPIHYNKFGDNLVSCFLKYIDYIINTTSYNIVLVPHDIRESTFGKYSDYQLLDIIYNKISKEQQSRVFFFSDKTYINAAVLKYVAYSSQIVITGRMHYSIAALSNSVPVIVMPYQGKFEGMLLEIYNDIDGYVLNEDKIDFEELKTKSIKILGTLDNEKELIDSKKIKLKAKINFELFE